MYVSPQGAMQNGNQLYTVFLPGLKAKARIYWGGVDEFGELQAERYYEALIQRFGIIAKSP